MKTSNGGGTVELKREEFGALKAALRDAGKLRVRVGILGSHVDRGMDEAGRKKGYEQRFDRDFNEEPLTNPEIGAIHEFGRVGDNPLPARSFLRMPLQTKLVGEVDKIGKKVFQHLIIKKDVRTALKALGVVAENVIQAAFATGGFGLWKKLSAYTIRKKKSSAILIDTAQLRKSITSAVTDAGGNRKT